MPRPIVYFSVVPFTGAWIETDMSYIRFGTALPSGRSSGSYVIGNRECLMNFKSDSKAIPYPELVELFKNKAYDQLKVILRRRLNLSAEETEIVCERLFDEHKAGEWEQVPVY